MDEVMVADGATDLELGQCGNQAPSDLWQAWLWRRSRPGMPNRSSTSLRPRNELWNAPRCCPIRSRRLLSYAEFCTRTGTMTQIHFMAAGNHDGGGASRSLGQE